MDNWSNGFAKEHIHSFETLNEPQRKHLIAILDEKFPPKTYEWHADLQKKAFVNAEESRHILAEVTQRYPRLIRSDHIAGSLSDLHGYAIVLTAGGDGVRMRSSLRSQGVDDGELQDFIKATYQIPGFPKGFGSLQADLAVIEDLSKQAGFQIPVIVTTGPKGSTTARVIPKVIDQNNSFGLTHIRTLNQGERLHLSVDGKIVFTLVDGMPWPATNPDETGGPFMKMKKKGFEKGISAIEWLQGLGCKKIIALQATALFDPSIIIAMAHAGKQHDCVGVGVLRKSFEAKDPFGTFVALEKDGKQSVAIVEHAVRNETTMTLMDPSNTYHLPYNTGLYIFDTDLLTEKSLPDYATPPKEIVPLLPKSPKVGYAATDLIALAKDPAVLSVNLDCYENIKTVDDLQKLSDLGKRYGIIDICKRAG